VTEWLHLFLRWFHVFAAILWIGSTWLFTWLDGWFGREAALAPVWMVHSGGFYRVEKLKDPGKVPERLHWFKWEALATWLSGLALLGLLFYAGSDMMVDDAVSSISPGTAKLAGVGVLVVGWFVYDGLMLSPLGGREVAAGAVATGLAAAVAWGLLHLFAARAAYIHVGALFGTLMTANVWVRILPAQRRMVAALQAGRPPSVVEGERAKKRSKQNSFMGVATAMIMLSNHFPTATYGSDHAWLVLCGLILAGFAGAKWLRSH
jgi:uncharacterized membrane protein